MNAVMLTLGNATAGIVLEARGEAPPAWRWWGARIDAAGLPPLAPPTGTACKWPASRQPG